MIIYFIQTVSGYPSVPNASNQDSPLFCPQFLKIQYRQVQAHLISFFGTIEGNFLQFHKKLISWALTCLWRFFQDLLSKNLDNSQINLYSGLKFARGDFLKNYRRKMRPILGALSTKSLYNKIYYNNCIKTISYNI